MDNWVGEEDMVEPSGVHEGFLFLRGHRAYSSLSYENAAALDDVSAH